MSEPLITVHFDPTPDVLQPIGQGLREHLERQAGPNPRRPVAVRAIEANAVVGGGHGWFQWGWLYTDWLWVAESARGKGLGRALLFELERLARDVGLRRARLNTASFQAPDFYEKLGYRVFAELPATGADGREHVEYFLRKEL